MSKMSRKEREAYERAMERRKRMNRQTGPNRRRPDPSSRGDGRRVRRRYEEERYTYDDYDQPYGRYDTYEEEEYRPRRRRMPEDLDFRYEKRRKRPERTAPSGRGERYQKPVRRKKAGRLILLIQLFATVLFLLSAVYLGMFPWLYLGIASIVLLLLALGVYRMQNGFRPKRFLGTLLGLALSAILVAGSFFMYEVRSALGKITDGNEAPELTEKAAGIDVSQEPFSVYISGIDVYGEITQQSRSDVNIIATVNPKSKEVLLVTTPRDYYVEIPGVSEGQKDKLTHAGNYGIGTSIATLENLYEVDIPFYVRVNFTSLIQMVDTLGGIDVKSELEFDTGEESGLVMHVEKGLNHFNGQEALAFVRERHALEDGDNQRGKNQQAVIEAMIKKAMSPSILIKGPKLIDQVSGNTETNMTTKQLQELVRAQLTGLNGWNVTSVAAEGTSARKYCYSYSGGTLYVTIPDEASVADIRDKINAVEEGK